MTEQMAIEHITHRYNIAKRMVGKGVNSNDLQDIEVALKALEEIQQYRAIENELKEKYHANVDIKMLMQHFIETIFKGEKHEGFCILTNEDAKEWEELKAIGTVEELQALKEKSVAMKVEVLTEEFSLFGYDEEFDIYYCPSCSARMGAYDEQEKPEQQYCEYCGQHLDWE